MHVAHSLIPYPNSRPFTRHAENGYAGLPAARGQQEQSQTVSSNRKNGPADDIIEGELLGKPYSFDTLSSERIKRLFIQQREAGEFTRSRQQSLDIKGAIDTYTDNARLTGADQPVYANAIDVFV